MSLQREAIMTAIYNKLAGVTGISTYSRRLQAWEDMPQAKHPAMFVSQGNQRSTQQTGLRALVELDAKIRIYTFESDKSLVPSTQINCILDQIQAILETGKDTNGKLTLGGLVHHCWLNGNIETDEGLLGNQSVAIATITVLATA